MTTLSTTGTRREPRSTVLLAYLTVLLAVAILYYPTTFTPRQQTVFGWIENDVYTGLLMIAAYLGVHRLSGTTLSPGLT